MAATGIPQKVKKGFLAFLEAQALEQLNGFAYRRGIGAGLMTMPAIAATVVRRDPLYESEEDGPWKVTLELSVITPATFDDANKCESAEDSHDESVEAVESVLWPEAVMAFLNSENTSNRPVQKFHMSPFNRPTIETVYQDKYNAFYTGFTVQLIVQNDDGDVP